MSLRPARFLLPVLLLMSGFCGIAYEILYAKLLGNLLGDRFTISASVLLTFLLGIGLGTLLAHRMLRWLWAIEASIGLYAAAMVFAYDSIDRLIYAWLPGLGTSVWICAAVSVVLLSLPAFLVGCSVPLFAAYLSRLRSERAFSRTYAIYNMGAGLTALAMEFALLRWVGLRNATLSLALLNLVVAVGLLALLRGESWAARAAARDWVRFSPRLLTALAIASVGSAIFQLLMIKLAECFMGPFNETLALVLAVVLIGLACGSWLTSRWPIRFESVLLLALGWLVSLMALLPFWVEIYARLYAPAAEQHLTLVLLKLGFMLALMGPPAVGFGATVPALLQVERDVARESGQLLFVSSMANVLGFFLMAFVLHRYLEYGVLLMLVGLLAALAIAIHTGLRARAAQAAIVLFAIGVVLQQASWNEQLLYYGHKEFRTSESYERARNRQFSADGFRGAQDLFAIIKRDGRPFFFINGYISITLTAASEKVVGAISSAFSPRTDQALVFGVGSGATAGTVGLLFDRVDAVEINGTVLANLHRMAEYNLDLVNQPNVNLIHDDGIHYIKTTDKRYSLILNTVTSPLYFSSSKLYTQDFFELVKRRLEPDGVYTTWIDQDIGDHGVDIILNTLDTTFEHCWLTFVKSSYYLMVCSDEEPGLHQLESVLANETLQHYMANHYAISLDSMPYGVLSTSARNLVSGPTPINRLDHPVLEHHMASIDGNTRLYRFSDTLREKVNGAELDRALRPWFDWKPGGFAYWVETRLERGSLLDQTMRQVIERQYGDLREAFASAALENAERVGTAEAFEVAGKRLYERDDYDSAERALSRSIALNSELDDAQYYLGRCLERRGETEGARVRFRRVLELDPEHTKAQQALARITSGAAG